MVLEIVMLFLISLGLLFALINEPKPTILSKKKNHIIKLVSARKSCKIIIKMLITNRNIMFKTFKLLL